MKLSICYIDKDKDVIKVLTSISISTCTIRDTISFRMKDYTLKILNPIKIVQISEELQICELVETFNFLKTIVVDPSKLKIIVDQEI